MSSQETKRCPEPEVPTCTTRHADGFFCTLQNGHSGPHEAWGDNKLWKTWHDSSSDAVRSLRACLVAQIGLGRKLGRTNCFFPSPASYWKPPFEYMPLPTEEEIASLKFESLAGAATGETAEVRQMTPDMLLTKWRDGSISQQKFYRTITHSGATTACRMFAEAYHNHRNASLISERDEARDTLRIMTEAITKENKLRLKLEAERDEARKELERLKK